MDEVAEIPEDTAKTSVQKENKEGEGPVADLKPSSAVEEIVDKRAQQIKNAQNMAPEDLRPEDLPETPEEQRTRHLRESGYEEKRYEVTSKGLPPLFRPRSQAKTPDVNITPKEKTHQTPPEVKSYDGGPLVVNIPAKDYVPETREYDWSLRKKAPSQTTSTVQLSFKERPPEGKILVLDVPQTNSKYYVRVKPPKTVQETINTTYLKEILDPDKERPGLPIERINQYLSGDTINQLGISNQESDLKKAA